MKYLLNKIKESIISLYTSISYKRHIKMSKEELQQTYNILRSWISRKNELLQSVDKLEIEIASAGTITPAELESMDFKQIKDTLIWCFEGLTYFKEQVSDANSVLYDNYEYVVFKINIRHAIKTVQKELNHIIAKMRFIRLFTKRMIKDVSEDEAKAIFTYEKKINKNYSPKCIK